MIEVKIPVSFTYKDDPSRKMAEANKQAKAAAEAQRREAQQNARLQKDIEKAERARLKAQEQEAKAFFAAQRAEAQQNAKLEADIRKRELAEQRAIAAQQREQQRALAAEQKAQQRALAAEQKAQAQAARAAYQAQRREAQQQLKLERDIEKAQRDQEKALKDQIAQRRRLNSLTKKLDEEIPQVGGRRRDNLAAGIGSGLATIGTLVSASALATGAVELARQADQAAVTDRSFARLSGSAEAYTANMAAMERATRGLVSTQQQQAIANQLLGMRLVENDDQLEQLVGGARRLGKEFRGMGAADAAGEFAVLLANMSYERLDQFGLSSGKVRQRVSELKEAGMGAEEAFRTAVFEEMEKTLARLGPEVETTTGKIDKMSAKFADLKVSSGGFLSEFMDSTGLLDAAIEGVEGLTSALESYKIIRDSLTGAGFEFDPSLEGIKNVTGAVADVVNPIGMAGESVWTFGKNMSEGRGFIDSWRSGLETLFEPVQNATNGIIDLTTNNEDLSQSTQDALEDIKDYGDTIEDTGDQIDEAAKKWEKFRKDFARELIAIDEQAQEDTDETWADYFDKEADNWKDHQKRLEDIRKRAAKDIAKADKDLQKDLAKVNREESKDIRRIREDAAREERNERKRRRIDAAADERLFNFELKQLAAEGQGNAILEALERRKIEEEIARDKADVENQIEDEKLQVEIERVREAAAEKRQELRQNAAEEAELRREALEEARAEEVANYEERREDLVQWREEKLAEIEESRKEAIEELGKELAESEEITKAQLKELKDIAARQGKDIGEALADGVNQGYAENLQVSGLLGDDTPSSGGGGAGGGRGSAGNSRNRNRELARTGPQWGFANGGSFIVGGVGGPDSQLVQFMASPNERVTVSTPAQQAGGGMTFVSNVTVGAGLDAARVQALWERWSTEAFQQFTDEVLAPALR